jgi:peptidoglycan-N-acetylglucosamine deacetylase
MRSWLSFLLFTLISPVLYAESTEVKKPTKNIIITIDDEPLPGSTLFKNPLLRAQKIIYTLNEFDVPPIGIFVVGQHLRGMGDASVRMYGESGRAIIGNHTEKHRGLSRTRSEVYIKDIQSTDALISKLPGFMPIFRYPYLDGGSVAKRALVEKSLAEMNYTSIPVTVDNKDYYLNALLRTSLNRQESVDFEKLKDLYVDHMMKCARYADALYDPESGSHVLLMHANDLTALYLGDLIKALRSEGWTIVSIKDHKTYAKLRMKPEPFQPSLLKAFQLAQINTDFQQSLISK